MKSKICLAILLLLSISVGNLQAQQLFGAKGQKVITGSGNIYSQKNETSFGTVNAKQSSISHGLNLSYGKFYKENVLSAAFIGYVYNEIENSSATTNQPGNFYNAGISQTYYTNLGKKFYFGIGGQLSGSYAKSSYFNGPDSYGDRKTYSGYFSITPSFSYQINKRFVSNVSTGNNFFGLQYSNSKSTDIGIAGPRNATSNTFNLNAGFNGSPLSNIYFGFSYLLK